MRSATNTKNDDYFHIEDEEEETSLKKDLENLFYNIRKNNKYPMEATETRNVIMVGRTRSGKSTGVKVLKDPCYEPKEMSIFSDTVDPKFHSFSIDDIDGFVKYTLNIVDTPGLKEVKKMGEDSRSDEVIINTINYCLKNEITKINCLLIFISFELGVTKDDLDSFKTFMEKFGHDEIAIGICITRSEDKSKEWKRNIIEQLQNHEYFSQVLQRENVKVLFMGCVDAVKNKSLTNISDVKRLYFSVYKMREELLKMIFAAEKQVMIVDLPIAMGVKENLMDLFKKQDLILNLLEKASDFGLAGVKMRLNDFAINLKSMIKKSAILLEPGLNNLFLGMKQRVKEISQKIDDPSLRKKFIGDIVF